VTIASSHTRRAKDAIGRYGWTAVLALALVAMTVYVIDADETVLSVVAIVGYGIFAVLAMVTGIALHRPTVGRPWRLLVIGLALFVVGDIVFEAVGEGPAQFPYIAAYGFLIAGLILGAQYRNRRVNGDAALDALLVSGSTLVCLWMLVVDPTELFDNGSPDWSTVVNLLIFPILDVLLLSVILRSAFRWGGAASVPGALIFASAAVTAACDIGVVTATVHGSGAFSDSLLTFAYGGFLVAYGLLAAAALHPQMASLYDAAQGLSDAGRIRLFAVLTAPTAPLLVAAGLYLRGDPLPVWLLLGSGLVLFLLSFVRLTGIINRLVREAHRDEELRRYSERLLTAREQEEAVAAASSAARRIANVDVVLVPAGSAPEALTARVEADGAEPLELMAEGVDSQRARVHALLGVLADGLSVTFARLAAVEREQEALRTLQAQNERLLELDAMKQSFISMVSHELRTPLTSIVGYLELLREGEGGELTEDQARFLEVMDRNATRLQRLVDDILMISRADSDRLKLTLEPVDVGQLVQRSAESAGPVARDKGVELIVRAEDELPEVEGDRRLLAQLLDNLVSNAVKFTPEAGTVTIQASREGGEVVVEVTDTGSGIPADEVPRLFERFFRASTAADVPGTGLGLAIAKAIVETHGGSIGVESELGSGSTFRVVIPPSPPSRAEEPVRDRVEA
jgi:signal transduction histidine kinase